MRNLHKGRRRKRRRKPLPRGANAVRPIIAAAVEIPGMQMRVTNDRMGIRKLRLFACACCRRVAAAVLPPRMVYNGFDAAIAVAERYADGLASGMDLLTAIAAAGRHAAALSSQERSARWWDERLTLMAAEAICSINLNPGDVKRATEAAESWVTDYGRFEEQIERALYSREFAAQSSLLLDIVYDPFEAPPKLPGEALAWNDGTVGRLAQGIYEDRKPDGTLDGGRLGILADALLDAGCDDERLLEHLRREGPHVRGCWAVDVILGKE